MDSRQCFLTVDAVLLSPFLRLRMVDLEIANDTLNNGEMAVVNVGQTLEVLGNLISSQSGVMQGAGRFEADGMILIEGKLEVGTDSQTEIWLDANPIQLTATAETEIELFSATEFDELILQDVANLGGDLNIVLRDGFVPDSSDNFTIVSNQGPLDLNGEFDNSGDGTVTTSDGMGVFDVTYGNTTVVLSNFRSAVVLIGDVNGDGVVNLLDVAPFVEALADGTFVPEADINQDGTVDLLDVAPFVQILAG